MSTVISSIIISGIAEGYTAEYIANVLWKQGLAQISRITMLPYLEHDTNTMCFTAYADIQQWADTEAAFNFIKRLDKTFVARIVYHDDDAWHVRLNTHYNANDNVHLFAYSTNFNHQYYLQPLEKGEENTLPVGENIIEDEDCNIDQEEPGPGLTMEDLDTYYNIIEDNEDYEDIARQLTEQQFDILFHHFDLHTDTDTTTELYDEQRDIDIQDQRDMDDCWDTLIHDCHMKRLQDYDTDTQSTDTRYNYDYNYINNILDRIQGNRLDDMEKGLHTF